MNEYNRDSMNTSSFVDDEIDYNPSGNDERGFLMNDNIFNDLDIDFKDNAFKYYKTTTRLLDNLSNAFLQEEAKEYVGKENFELYSDAIQEFNKKLEEYYRKIEKSDEAFDSIISNEFMKPLNDFVEKTNKLLGDIKDTDITGKYSPAYKACMDFLRGIEKNVNNPEINEKFHYTVDNYYFRYCLVESRSLLKDMKTETDPAKKDEMFNRIRELDMIYAETDAVKKDADDGNVFTSNYEDLMFKEMADDKAFCDYKIKKAREKVEEYLDLSKVRDVDLFASENELQECAIIIACGERFNHERKLAGIQKGDRVIQPLKDFVIPNSYFRDEVAFDETEEDRNTYLNNMVESIKENFRYSTMMIGSDAKRLENMAYEINSDLGTKALHPENAREFTEQFKKVTRAGNDTTLYSSDDVGPALASTGSPEYTALHNAYAQYFTESRNQNPDMTRYIDGVADAAENYLKMKDTRPFTTSGKNRVEAASKIFTKAVLTQLQRPEYAESAYERLKTQLLRNPTCRKMVQDEISKHQEIYADNEFAAKAFLFAAGCDATVRSNNNISNGIICPGKLITDNRARDNQALQHLNEVAGLMEKDSGVVNKDGTVPSRDKLMSLFGAKVAIYNEPKNPAPKEIENELVLEEPKPSIPGNNSIGPGIN